MSVVGNPTQEQTPSATTVNAFDAANRLLKQKTGTSITSYSYDAYGSRTSKKTGSGITTYTWDDDHRLKQVVLAAGAGMQTYTYNADGLRFSRQTAAASTTKYVWNGQILVAEANQSNVLQVGYTQGPGGFGDLISRYRIGAAATDYPLYDALGSLDRILSQAQAQSGRSAYDAYGNPLVSGDTTLQCVAEPGYYYDSTLGLYYVRQRWYDPVTKQWTAPDPSGYRDGFNLYWYVQDSPLTFLDPKGTTLFYCTRGAQGSPGRHGYFYDDFTGEGCAMFSAGSSGGGGGPGGPCDNPNDRGPASHHHCVPIAGTNPDPTGAHHGVTTTGACLMQCCKDHCPLPKLLIWLPFISDCHNTLEDCLNQCHTPKPPGVGRFQ